LSRSAKNMSQVIPINFLQSHHNLHNATKPKYDI